MDVVGTAGHVDHGKSTLVRALTGMEPDRFAEEQRRGLTIDIGFAWSDLGDGSATRTVAFVDLPGHERFIANMLAGAGPLEVALFTVAADEGWKPQSTEHLDILDLLAVSSGVIAVTKSDLADADQIERTRAQIDDHVAGTSLEHLPVVDVSAVTGAGLNQLRGALVTALGARRPVTGDSGHPRLWVDRSFSIKGAGTVVTGTLTGGTLRTGDEMLILPSGQRARVRGLESLRQHVPAAAAGDRVAVNLSGVEREAVARGDVLTVADAPAPTALLDVEIRTLRGAEVGRRGAWHAHVGSGDWPVRLQPLGHGPITDRGYARVLVDRTTGIVTGDRLILRDAGRQTTVAGGVVLDAAPPPLRGAAQRRRRVEQLDARAAALVARDRSTLLALHVAERSIVPAAPAAAAAGLSRAGAQAAASEHGLGMLAGGWVHPPDLAAWAAAVTTALQDHHRHHPDERSVLRSLATAAAVRAGCPDWATADLLQALLRLGRIAGEGTGVRLAGHRVQLSPAQERSRAALVAALDREPFAPPRLGQAAAEAGADPVLVKEMEAAGELVRLDADLAMTASAVDQAATLLRRRYQAAGPLTAAQAKEALQTSRKFALPLLEELDRRGITRREGDIRHVP